MNRVGEAPRDRDWMIATGATGCLAIASVLLFWNPRFAENSAVETAAIVAKVSFSSADLRRRPVNRLGWSNLSAGGELRELDALFVPPGVEAKVTFLDGTVLELDERALVVVGLPRAGRRSVTVRQGSVEGSAGAAGLSLATLHGTAQLAPQSKALLEVDGDAVALAITQGEVTLGEKKFVLGERAGLSSKGTITQPKWPVQLEEPTRNNRQLFRFEPPRIAFAWRGPSPQGSRLQLARDRGFAFVLEEHDANLQPFTARRAEVGVFWWRVVDDAARPISESRRFTVLEDVPPKLLSPSEGEVVLTDEKHLALFSWAQVRGVSRYRLELSASPNFSQVAFTHTVDGVHLRTALELAEGRWFWRMRAIDEGRLELAPSQARALRLIHRPLPDAPVLLNTEIEVEPAPTK